MKNNSDMSSLHPLIGQFTPHGGQFTPIRSLHPSEGCCLHPRVVCLHLIFNSVYNLTTMYILLSTIYTEGRRDLQGVYIFLAEKKNKKNNLNTACIQSQLLLLRHNVFVYQSACVELGGQALTPDERSLCVVRFFLDRFS